MRNQHVVCEGCSEEFNLDDYLDEDNIFNSPTESCGFCEQIFCVEGSEKYCYELHECSGHEPTKYQCELCGQTVDILEKGSNSCLVCQAKELVKAV